MADQYRSISNFGKGINNPADNPLSYCLQDPLSSQFLHGASSYEIHAWDRPCQSFMAQYCAQGWDGYCELGYSNNNSTEAYYPNQLNQLGGGIGGRLTQGQILLVNTACEKYLVEMLGGQRITVPFDYNVADSPFVSSWCDMQGTPFSFTSYMCYTCSRGCTAVPVFAVNPHTIDDDIVMNKLLQQPWIASLLFVNIYNTMKRAGTLSFLRGTKLGKFYESTPYFQEKGGI